MADLNGSWTGTYWQRDRPTRFEATFAQGGNSLSGRIEDDGELGEAQITGEVIGRKVMFTKTYLAGGIPKIEYVGTIDDEGDAMRGDWTIPGYKHQGKWEARRSGDDLMQQLRRRIEQQTPVGAR
jgi:hypothetical protein